MKNSITKNQLIPGNSGKECPFNGEHSDKNGVNIECRCDECEYLMCCIQASSPDICHRCTEHLCPRRFTK